MTAALRFFSPPPRPANEDERQAAVDRLRLVEAGDDPRLATIVAQAAALFDAPTAVISIIDNDRQWWIVRHGIEGEGTPRALSFCGHTVLTPDVLAVRDARADDRFAGNPLVTGAMADIRFYAGAPIVHDGAALGALCVIDAAPHEATAGQRAELAKLAADVVAILDADYR